MKKALMIIISLTLLLSIVLTGCSSGVSQADYDALLAQLADARTQLNDLQADLSEVNDAKAASEAALQNQIDELSRQMEDLKVRYEWIGLSTAEIAEKIVQNYNATHVYSQIDLFVCSDMASEVWNMLKAKGIASVIVIGNKDMPITDIMQSNHAWVLADIGDGQKLALETTGGFSVSRDKNPLYYRGWTFASPSDLKKNNDLRKEHDLRVGFRNLLAAEVNNAMNLYNNSGSQVEADKYFELYNKLKELKDAQETIINQLKVQITELAAQL